ncbi:MAG: glutamate synthase subunit beta [Planctomycetes bacterium]|nr:glutamate synthase subunit beta [Planctomycetota bacterium]
MAKTKGFLEYKRQKVGYRPVENRVKDFQEIEIPLTPEAIKEQAARCIDCGIPFCHGSGCPVFNLIPEFNEMIYRGQWQEACENLHSTNNFPEITGRICPAPCETACTLAINDDPVLIRHIEHQIVERGFKEGWIVPIIARQKTGKRVAVIGSGPAGLAAAQQLVRAGHDVVVFEKDEQAGGLLRYGIPDFKLEKSVIDRRLEQLKQEGVKFQMGLNVGVDISKHYLEKMFDCVCLTMGAGQPRDLMVSGRGYDNIFFAMDFLTMQNRLNSSESVNQDKLISARDKDVVVIGGGDTGSDCVGTARRQGAKSITQLEILPKPPQDRPQDTPWPMWPRTMRTSSSQEEGCERQWGVMTKRISGVGTRVSKLQCCRVEWEKKGERWEMREIDNSEFELKADLVLLSMGFVHVAHEGLIETMQIKLDQRGNVQVNNYQTSEPWVFAAGDTTSGASLVVRAIDAGRKAADAIDQYLR